MVDDTIDDLEKFGCIEIEDEFRVTTTNLGFNASFYYIKPQTISLFSKNISNGMSMIKLLELISDAVEFSEVPVR